MNSLYFYKQLYIKNRAKSSNVLVYKSNNNNNKTRNRCVLLISALVR